jgi:hypothetical protein
MARQRYKLRCTARSARDVRLAATSAPSDQPTSVAALISSRFCQGASISLASVGAHIEDDLWLVTWNLTFDVMQLRWDSRLHTCTKLRRATQIPTFEI